KNRASRDDRRAPCADASATPGRPVDRDRDPDHVHRARVHAARWCVTAARPPRFRDRHPFGRPLRSWYEPRPVHAIRRGRMMRMDRSWKAAGVAQALLVAITLASPASATLVPGGGSASSDCYVELDVSGITATNVTKGK